MMINLRPLLRAAPISALLFAFPACSVQDADPQAPNPLSHEIDAATGAMREDAVAAQDPQEKLKQQRNRFLVQKYLREAKQAEARGDLDTAILLLERGLSFAPGNRQLQERLAATRRQKGEPAGTVTNFGDTMTKQYQIAEQRAKAKVRQHIQSAKADAEALRYDKAIQELRTALLTVETTATFSWGDQKSVLATMIAEVTKQRDEHESAMMADQRRDQLEALRRAERLEEQQRIALVNSHLKDAQTAFVNGDPHRAVQLCEMALEIDRRNEVARNLLETANKTLRAEAATNYYRARATEYLKQQRQREEMMRPMNNVIEYDQEIHARAQRRGRNLPTESVIPEDVALTKKVRETTLQNQTFNEDNGDYANVFKLLNTWTNVPIIITKEGKEILDSESPSLNLNLTAEISLEKFLDLMTSKTEGLAWTIRGGTVLITNKAKAGGNLVTKAVDIRTLIMPMTEFLPPTIKDIPTGENESFVSRTGGEAEEKQFFIEIDELVSNLKRHTDFAYWDTDGPKIDQIESGYLLVKASPSMHRKVAEFLNDMDRFSSSVVTVETKFLEINENFLQQIGVDLRGLGGAGTKGSVAPLDDLTNGLVNNASRGLDNAGTADPAASPISGLFFNDGADGDIRGRTENYFEDTMGKIMTPNGGLTAAWTFLDDLQVNMIFHAVEKSENAQIMNAQTVTVLNRNRANMAVINQTSYVRDFEVEVAQASFIADPKIDVIHDGVVLDIKPIIRHDRQAVTLNLEPTIAELVRPIPTFTTSLAGSTLPVTLQLPQMTVKSLATTTEVPDGGTVLLGGLRTILSRERRAESPFFSKIPIISFFFKEEGVIDEASSLMIMVKARITDTTDNSARPADK